MTRKLTIGDHRYQLEDRGELLHLSELAVFRQGEHSQVYTTTNKLRLPKATWRRLLPAITAALADGSEEDISNTERGE